MSPPCPGGHDELSFALPDLAGDFYAVLDELSPGVPVHVLAHDWGSIEVWEAVCEPGAEERVASFTSMSGPNLDHLASWVRRNLLRPTPRRILQMATQGLSSSYVPLRPDCLRESEHWTERLVRVEVPFGHWAAITHPDVVAQETERFIDSVEQAEVVD